jgi:cell division protein ZapA (FtsZ GTPase activity inhibitor)
MSAPTSKIGLNNRFQSYQHGTYQPPPTYTAQQTEVLVDTMKTQYAAEGTANDVLTQMTEQRHQLTGAHDNVWHMRAATDNAKRELQELNNKYQSKKMRLYFVITALGIADIMLFLRIAQCRGGFFC